MSGKMIAIAANVCAFGVTGLGIASFAQQTQAPSMPADLANMAQSARARMAEAAQSPESRPESADFVEKLLTLSSAVDYGRNSRMPI